MDDKLNAMEDYSSALKAVENTLRDFIQEVLSKNLGERWVEQCGVTPERIGKWKQRQGDEERKIRGRGVEKRLLYYADFYDLPVIMKKHWTLFEPCFGKWKHMEVYLDKLEDFRNPEAHRRELFPHEIYLILGITGEIRTAVTNFRSQQKPEDEFFPRFEQVTDSFGNVVTTDDRTVETGLILHPGDEVDFLATAWDPRGEPCEFSLYNNRLDRIVDWTRDYRLKWEVCEKDIAKKMSIYVFLRSRRPYHASIWSDDSVIFTYTVLPRE